MVKCCYHCNNKHYLNIYLFLIKLEKMLTQNEKYLNIYSRCYNNCNKLK